MASSMLVRFTQEPVRVTASGVQSIYQAVDLGGRYRILDLMLSTYFLTPSCDSTVRVETSMEATDDDGWVTMASFAKESSGGNKFQIQTFTGVLRYVRYGVILAGVSPVVVFDISGYARVRK